MNSATKSSLIKEGYITHYLYSGKKETEFSDDYKETNQLRYEKYVRSKVARHDRCEVPQIVDFHSNSPLGLPWKYYYAKNNIFFDASHFYPEMRKIEMWAVTEIDVEEDRDLDLMVWSYPALDLWINNEHVTCIKNPVYKPIQSKPLTYNFKKGKNRIFIRIETLGVRDTRIAFALQVLNAFDSVWVTLPAEAEIEPFFEVENLLNSAMLQDGFLKFEQELPPESSIVYHRGIVDFRLYDERELRKSVTGYKTIKLMEYEKFHIEIIVGDSKLIRQFEQIERQTATYLPTDWVKDLPKDLSTNLLLESGNHREWIYKHIGEVTSLIRSEKDGFAIFPMLSRYYQGMRTESDQQEFMVTLKQIERRMDCADFMTCGLIRFMNEYEMSLEMEIELKRVLLQFRYWMDEDGQDGMCFWSENHSLMFYQSAYFFGLRYCEDLFVRSGKKGIEVARVAKARLIEWFQDVLENGFDEFNSGVYSPITLAAMLNVVDYGDEVLSEMASKAVDLFFERFVIHFFKGTMVSPQGRVYRDAIYPYKQSAQGIVNFLDSTAPYVYCEWLIPFATSKYRIKEELYDLMKQEGFIKYSTSNAMITVCKTKDYILTSVESPRRDGISRVWAYDYEEEHRGNFSYTRTLNEAFHGTTQFEPGVFGYQQHMWYAALDTELSIFINHPGQSCEAMSESRPGYWYGNGIMPALKQEKNILGIIYVIPEDYPIHFTHVFWNTHKFDEVKYQNKWLFGSKGDSYIGIWSSNQLVDHNDVLFQCEKRSYGSEQAFVIVCGSKEEHKNWESFREACCLMHIDFDIMSRTLIYDETALTYKANVNLSQFVE
jgi:hypothetical protein